MPNRVDLKPGERIDDLGRGGLKLIQDRSAYSFGLDAVLLAHWVRARGDDFVVELGAGNGALLILLTALVNSRRLVGFEIQPVLADMARRSIALNGLEGRVTVVRGNLLDAPGVLGPGSADVVVSNPPYWKEGSGALNPGESQAIARHEILCTLQDVMGSAARLLKAGGDAFFIHRTERLVDVLCEMRRHGMEPKRLRMVHPKPGEGPNLFLVRGTKGAREGMIVEKPLFVHDPDGGFSAEMRVLYDGD